MVKIKVVASVRTGVSNSPPDCCAAIGSTPSCHFQKRATHLGGSFLEQGTGVEPAFTAWEAVVLPIYEPCVCRYYSKAMCRIQAFFGRQEFVNFFLGGCFLARFSVKWYIRK